MAKHHHQDPTDPARHEAHRRHDHHNDDPAAHREEPDPHVWLSPRLARLQAQTICDELRRIDPAHKGDYRKNRDAFHADLDRLDRKIAERLAPLKGRTFYVLHPAFGYFASHYGLRQEAVEIGGKSPPLKHIEEILKQAGGKGVKVIFVQPQFWPKAAETIAAQIGAKVVVMNPLARDYVGNLEDVAEKIQRALNEPAE